MTVTAISPGPVIQIIGGVVYALPGSACLITTGSTSERSNIYTGPFVGWPSTSGVYNHVGGFVRPLSDTWIQARKIKMDGTIDPVGGSPVRDDDAYYSALIMKDKPSYYWSLNEESGLVAVDSVGGANGTISGGVTLNQPGAAGKGMLFDGVDDKIQTANNVTIPLVCTIEGWFKFSPVVFTKPMFTTRGIAGGTGDTFSVGVGAARVSHLLGGANPAGSVVLVPDVWNHLVYILNGQTVTFYVNGILDRTQPHIRTVQSVSQCQLGWDSGVAALDGSIDEVAIYPYALTPQQIQSHYFAKSVPPNSYASMIVNDGASNYWQLDEEGGTTAVDIKGGKNGVISGGVTLNQAGIGKSYLFNGTTGRATVGSVDFPATCTIEAWIKSSTAAFQTYISNGSGGNALSVGISGGGGTPLYIYGAGLVYGVRDVANGQWHHTAFVFDGATAKIYLDSILEATHPYVRTGFTGVGTIGAENAANWVNGNIDEVAIYPYALTAQQIRNHYLFKVAPSGSYASTILASQPTNYWQLDEEGGLVANDIVGGKHGTISGALVNQVGANGKSMLFDGVDDKFTTALDVSIPVVVTIESWVKSTTQNNYYFSNRTSSQNLVIGSSGIGATLFRSQVSNGLKTINDNKWHHVVWVLDGVMATVYVDGVLDNSSPQPWSTPGLSPLRLGWDAWGNVFWVGGIDEVAIYNRALSASEIQSHYLAKFGITNPSSYAAKVVLSGPSNYWRLNETSGLVANDIVGGAAGTISGGVTLNGESGMTFDGTGDYVSIPNGSYVAIGTGPFTIECWLKPQVAGSATSPFIIENGGGANGSGFAIIRPGDSTIGFKIANGIISSIAQSPFPYDNQWHHVVGVLSRGTPDSVRLYIDGVQTGVLNPPANGWNITSSNALLFGTYSGGQASPDFRYFGSLDDVAIYPRALTPAEILEHYQSR